MSQNQNTNNKQFQRYNSVSPEIERRLAMSAENFIGQALRNVLCPYCGTIVSKVGRNNTGFIYARCNKCKHEEILDLRYFRTAKINNKNQPKVEPIPEFVPGIINYLLRDKYL